MLVVSEKHHGINLIDCWYAQEELKMDGIIRYKEALVPLGEQQEIFETLISNLTQEEETLLALCNKNCRYAIRRSPRDGVVCKMKDASEITDDDLEAFFTFFEGFWQGKGIVYTDKDRHLAEAKKYRDAGKYAMTMAELDGKVIIYHTYIVGDEFTRFLQSASQYRTDESLNAQVVSNANRYLQFEDMLYFKRQGKKVYDWGGAGTKEEVASITEFKRFFGGTPINYYNGEEVRGAAAKLYRAASQLAGKVMK